MLAVDEIHQVRAFLTLHHKLHRHAVLQIVRKDHVFLQERAGLKVFEFIHRVVQRRLRQAGIDGLESGQQLVLVQGRVIVPLDIWAIGVGIAQGLGEQL